MGARKTAMLAIAVIAILLIVQVSAVVGASKDDEKSELEVRVHLLYVSDVKPDNPGGGNGKPGGGGDETSGTYEVLAKGFVWKTLPITFYVHSSLQEYTEVLGESAETWDDATSTELFNSPEETSATTWYGNSVNDMLFGNYADAGVIAVTYTWGYWTGPPKSREIVEFDIMFDTDFSWGIVSDPDTDEFMDVQNIATHEIGHGLGLADLYNEADNQETMFGSADYGEITKRDLYKGDIAGIQSLYGE